MGCVIPVFRNPFKKIKPFTGSYLTSLLINLLAESKINTTDHTIAINRGYHKTPSCTS